MIGDFCGLAPFAGVLPPRPRQRASPLETRHYIKTKIGIALQKYKIDINKQKYVLTCEHNSIILIIK